MTDGRTDTGRQQRPRLSIASRGNTRSSADADKPAWSVNLEFSQGHQTYGSSLPFHVMYTFLLCNNFVFKSFISFSDISTSKNVVTLKSGSEVTQGHWRWYYSIDCVWFPIYVLYTMFHKKTTPYIIAHNFGKCWPIFNFFHPETQQRSCNELIIKGSSHLKGVDTLPCEM